MIEIYGLNRNKHKLIDRFIIRYLNKKRELDSLKLQNGCNEEEKVKFIVGSIY